MKRVLMLLVPVSIWIGCGAGGGGGGGGGGASYTLTVTKAGTGSGGGIRCGAVCSATVTSGTEVTLTASPDSGMTFVSFSGCDSTSGSSGSICTCTMNASKTVTATFDKATSNNASAACSNCLSACQGISGCCTGSGCMCESECYSTWSCDPPRIVCEQRKLGISGYITVLSCMSSDKDCCGTESTAAACIGCCQNVHFPGWYQLYRSVAACACGGTGKCQTECATDFCSCTDLDVCLNLSMATTPACKNCISSSVAPGGACDAQVTNACTGECANYVNCLDKVCY